MDWGNVLKELGARSSLLWGVAIGSGCLLLVDKAVSPLGLPQEWRWVLPVTVGISWAILFTELISTWWPIAAGRWKGRGERRRRDQYALKNLETAASFERAVLIYYKEKNQQRFRASSDAQTPHEMVKHGFLSNDSLDRGAFMQHYRIIDAVWKFLDNPPEGWDKGKRLAEINWE